MRELAELVVRIAELERRFANMMRHGTVEEVDAKKQRLRIRLGEGDDGAPFIGPWVPYAQIAGDLKLHTPPSKGQQMTMLNPTGDFRQAVAIPLTWSDRNQSPSEKPDEHVLSFGSVQITLKENELEFKVGNEARLLMTAEKIVAEVGQIAERDELQAVTGLACCGPCRLRHGGCVGFWSQGDAYRTIALKNNGICVCNGVPATGSYRAQCLGLGDPFSLHRVRAAFSIPNEEGRFRSHHLSHSRRPDGRICHDILKPDQ